MVPVAVSDADPLAHFTRLHRWLRRNTIPLGFYAEHWKPTLAHRGTERVRELGHHPADTEWHITGQLINGVIHSAGGVEYAASKLNAALDADEAYLDDAITQRHE